MGKEITLPCRYYRRYPIEQPLGLVEDLLTLPADETAFLLVDVYGLGFDEGYQYGDVSEFYKKYVDFDRDIIRNFIKPAKVAAKWADLPIIYVNNYLAPSTTENNEWRNMSIRTTGVDVLEEWRFASDVLAFSDLIAPEDGDYLIHKQHYSGFFETHLDSLLRELGTKNLVVVGFDSLICLHSTVLDALFRNYRVIVLRDCTGTKEYPETENGGWANWLAIRFVESNVGYTSTANDFISACDVLRSNLKDV